jgi:hypothetical protein
VQLRAASEKAGEPGPRPIRRCPFRSPQAVAEAIKDLVANRTVCDVGCAEGDMLAGLALHAREVVGFDCDPRRYRLAEQRGFRLVAGNYHLDELPEADVYYLWPDHGARDDRFLVDKILTRPGFKGTIIVAGDDNVPSEVKAVLACSALGRLLRVPFNEGSGYRESGVFLLAIIDAGAQPQAGPPHDERRAVVSMAIGDKFDELAALSIPGQISYARRLNAEHIVLRRPLLGAHSPFFEIFQIHRLFDDYARILYLDLDVLVRDDCPDLFTLVPAHALGVFFESRLVDREAEIRYVQALWPALGWVGDYFNNGVLVAGRAHRELFAADGVFPRGLRFADQTVMNYRAVAAGTPMHDIGFGLNYMPAILPRGPLLRFLVNHTGHDIWPLRGLYQALPDPASAHMVHGAGLPYPLKVHLARKTLSLWARGRSPGFSAGHRLLNRVFCGLLPQPARDVVLELGYERPLLRQPSGTARPLDSVELALWRLCDGKSTAEQIARGVLAALPHHPPGSLRQSVRRGLHKLLDAGFLEAVNQVEPVFAEQSTGDSTS